MRAGQLRGIVPVVLACTWVVSPARADWQPNGNPLCTASGAQSVPRLCPDGAGGALVTWLDGRAPVPAVHASHVLSDGTVAPGWPVDGLRVGPDPAGPASEPRIVEDAAGGAYVLFQILAAPNPSAVRLFHLTAGGATAAGWPPEGLLLTSACYPEARSAWIAADGAGGVYATWSAFTPHGLDVFLQRVGGDAQVAAGWPGDGAVVAGRVSAGGIDGDETSPTVIVDGVGAPWVLYRLWHYYAPELPRYVVDLFAVRMTPAGSIAPGWTAEGMPADRIYSQILINEVELTPPPPHTYAEQFAASGPDSSMFVGYGEIYPPDFMGCCDHVVESLRGGDGTVEWKNSTMCYTSAGTRLLSDESGGVFVCGEREPGFRPTQFDRRPAGVTLICGGELPLGDPASGLGSVFPDGANGFFALLTSTADLRLQHVDSAAQLDPTYPAAGAVLVTGVPAIAGATAIANGSGGFVTAWSDARNGQPDLFVLGSSPAVPAPGAGPAAGTPGRITVRVDGNATRQSAIAFVVDLPADDPATLDLVDVAGRAVAHQVLAAGGAGTRTVYLAPGRRPAPGLYFVRLRQGASEARTRVIVRR